MDLPRYALKPMPFATFGELPALGLALTVWCSGCKSFRPLEIGEALAGRRFGRVRFRCTRRRYDGAICGSRGHPQIAPAAPIDRNGPFVSLECARCLPPWCATDVILSRLPWSLARLDTRTERYRCPGCGGQVRATFHRGDRETLIAGHLLRPGA